MMLLLVVFGGAIVAGDLIQAIRFEAVVFALAAIFIIRPVGGWVSLLGCKQRPEAPSQTNCTVES